MENLTYPFQAERKAWQALRRRYGLGSFSAYEKRAFRSYQRTSTPISQAGLRGKVAQASCVVFGDDRLVSSDQEVILNLLRKWPGRKARPVLITNRVSPQHASTLRRYVKGDLSLERLLAKLSWESRGTQYAEGGNANLLRWVRANRGSVVCAAEGKSLAQQDRNLARLAQTWIQKKSSVVVWTGALRLAPVMLPRVFRERGVEGLFLSFHPYQTRWQAEGYNGWAELRPGLIGWLGQSPLYALEMYRAWSSDSSSLVEVDKLESTLQKAMQKISYLTHQKPSRARLELLHPFCGEFFYEMSQGGWPENLCAFLWERLVRGESAVVPELKLIFLATLDLGHLAEEAAHFHRLAGGKRLVEGPVGIAVEEALAFLASRWLDPERKVPQPENGPGDAWADIHRVAYEVGEVLSKRWRSSAKDRREIRRIWALCPKHERDAQQVWNALENLL